MHEYPVFKIKQPKGRAITKPIYNEEEVEYVQIIFDKDVVKLNLLAADKNTIVTYEADPSTMGRGIGMAIKLRPQWNITMKLD